MRTILRNPRKSHPFPAEREEMIDLLTTSYWSASERSKSFLTRMESEGFLFAKNARNEGFFLIWTPGGVSTLTRDTYSEIMREAKKHDLAARFHVYASSAPYVAQNVEFYKIPDEIIIDRPLLTI